MGYSVVVRPDWFDEAMDRGGMDWLDNVIGAQILDDAKDFVPIDEGNLHDSLEKVRGHNEIRVGSGVGEKEAMPYAARIELGFHGEDSLGRFYDQDGQPYLSPALLRRRG